jgi:hypothetical protein
VYAEISESNNGERTLGDIGVAGRAVLKLNLKEQRMRLLDRFNSLNCNNMREYLHYYFKSFLKLSKRCGLMSGTKRRIIDLTL